MSFLALARAQLGKSATAALNILLRTPDVPDGSLIVSKGTYDAPGATLATFNADGSVSPAAALASTENSQKSATTAWCKFGFAALLATTGFVKFPAWLGGLIFQWGLINTSSSASTTVTFPLAFPSALYGVYGCIASGPTLMALTINGVGLTNFACDAMSIGGRNAASAYWLSLGN